MAVSDRTFSRLVGLFKILLPLAALAILSTLFLLSDTRDPAATIPYTTIDIHEVARSQNIGRPSFAGATSDGDLIALTAEDAEPGDGNVVAARDVNASIELQAGGRIDIASARAQVDQPNDSALLTGEVTVTSSTGYRIETEEIESGLQVLRAETGGEIRGEGPPGRFTAGRMRLTTDPETGNAHLVFTDGVKLVYDPASAPNAASPKE